MWCRLVSDDVHDSPGWHLYDHEVPVQLACDACCRQHSPRRACAGRYHHHMQLQLRRQQVEPSRLYVMTTPVLTESLGTISPMFWWQFCRWIRISQVPLRFIPLLVSEETFGDKWHGFLPTSCHSCYIKALKKTQSTGPNRGKLCTRWPHSRHPFIILCRTLEERCWKMLLPLCQLSYVSSLDQCNFIARLCRATLSHDKIASVTWRVVQLLNSRATHFLIRAALYSVQLCRENVMNDWSILVYATKLQHATWHVTLSILSYDKVARQNHEIKLQVWHRSYAADVWHGFDYKKQ